MFDPTEKPKRQPFSDSSPQSSLVWTWLSLLFLVGVGILALSTSDVCLALLILAVPGFLVGMMAYLLPTLWVYAVLGRADYAAAFRRAGKLHRFPLLGGTVGFLQGTVHLFAGHYDKAEARFQEELASKAHSLTRSAC